MRCQQNIYNFKLILKMLNYLCEKMHPQQLKQKNNLGFYSAAHCYYRLFSMSQVP